VWNSESRCRATQFQEGRVALAEGDWFLERAQREEFAEPPHAVSTAHFGALDDPRPPFRIPDQPWLSARTDRRQAVGGAGGPARHALENPIHAVSPQVRVSIHEEEHSADSTRSARVVEKPGTAAISAALADLTAARLPKRSSSRVRLSGPMPGMSSNSDVMVR